MTNLSPQQQAVVNWVRAGQGSTFVEAVAGAGKTTTLIEILAEAKGSIGFAAYNKKIADEIKGKVANKSNPDHQDYDPRFARLGNRVRVGTFHSFGFGSWRRIHPDVKTDIKAKELRITTELQIPDGLNGFVFKLVSLAKQRALGLFGSIDDDGRWYDMVEHFDLAYEIENPADVAKGIDLAKQTLKMSREISCDLIDFDDMIYMPLVSGCRMWENDWILVDEAQDTNPARRALARKMLRPRGRAIFVGDRHQAIYGFTGADSDAIDQISRDFNCSTLPLTVTFRCPKSVVRMAQEVVSHIEAHETAPEGVTGSVEYKDMLVQQREGTLGLSPQDAILCRKTAPLVETAYTLIRQGTACHVEGRDIGAGLLKLANRFAARTLEQLNSKLDAWSEREVARLVAKGRETQAEALQDRVDTLKILMDTVTTVDELRQRITNMFQDSEHERKPTLTLATVHRSKGREWNRVFVLGRNAYMPSKWARQQWQLQQEDNLIYVAYTRAKKELVLVHVTEV